ncbi:MULTISPECIES: sulfite exporter TauE/SafE family protein [Bacillaceae]|uniref:urease accessory protein UreH domain-containing protein n=1 Tax=Bacillaceae TaxID=186817 RepID=UPI00315B065B
MFTKKIAWGDVWLFTMGKVLAFSIVGIILWVFGKEIEATLTNFFSWIRIFIGPAIILIGLFLLGVIKWKWSIPVLLKKGKIGNFP